MWHSYEQEITSFFRVKWTLGAVLQSADDHSSKRTSLMVIMSCEGPIELLVVSRLVLSGVITFPSCHAHLVHSSLRSPKFGVLVCQVQPADAINDSLVPGACSG